MSDLRQNRSERFAQLIGLELKANFAREGTSQAEVADKLGHSKSGYSRWINAKPSMPLEAFLNTCELIGIDPRNVVSAAYKRLIDEQGPIDNSESASAVSVSASAGAGRSFVSDDDVEDTIRKLASGLGVAAYRGEHKYDGDGDDPA